MSATEVKAVLKFVRISPQKVRKLVDAVKGKPAEAAIDMLKFMPQKGAAIVEKVVRSAVANAEQNHNLDIDTLVVKNVEFLIPCMCIVCSYFKWQSGSPSLTLIRGNIWIAAASERTLSGMINTLIRCNHEFE